MANVVILSGNLTRDIELKYTAGGTAVGKTAIAVNKKIKNKEGNIVEQTMFIDITFWGKMAETAHLYLHKGRKILIEGELVLEQWTAQDGTKRTKHSIRVNRLEMLGSASNGAGETAGSGQNAPQQSAPAKSAGTSSEVPEIDIDEDEIPF